MLDHTQSDLHILKNIRISTVTARILLILIIFVSYWQSLSFEFTYDDRKQIALNPYVISSLRSLEHFLSIFSIPTSPGDLYRPLVSATFRLNFLFEGLSFWHFHLVNIFIYIFVTLLVFSLCNLYFKNNLIAFTASLIFALHPLHVEAVANIYGRAELLAALFILSAICVFQTAVIKRNLILLFTSGVLFFLACLSKESALTGLILAPLFVYCGKFADKKLISRYALVWLFFGLIYLLLRSFVLGQLFISKYQVANYIENPLLRLNFLDRLLPALSILGKYVFTLVFPVNLSADYTVPLAELRKSIFAPAGLFYLTVFCAYILLLIKEFKNKIFVFLAWIFLSLLLTSNLLIPIGTLAADRLLFLPSVGFCVAAGYYLINFSKQKRRVFLLLFVCYFGMLAFFTQKRLPIWENNIKLFTQTSIDNPYSQKATFVLGVNYLEHKDYLKAKDAFEETLRRDPEYFMAMQFLALSYLNLGDKNKFAFWYKEYESHSALARKQFKHGKSLEE